MVNMDSTGTSTGTVGSTSVLIRGCHFNNNTNTFLGAGSPITPDWLGGAFIMGTLNVNIEDCQINGNIFNTGSNPNLNAFGLAFPPGPGYSSSTGRVDGCTGVQIRKTQLNKNAITGASTILVLYIEVGNNFEITDSELDGNSSDANSRAFQRNWGLFLASCHNIFPRNVTISNFTAVFPVAYGLLVENNQSPLSNVISHNVTINNIVALANTPLGNSAPIGIWNLGGIFGPTNNIKHVNCTVQNLSGSSTGSFGFRTEFPLVEFENCEAANVIGTGFSLDTSSLLLNCRSKNNGLTGFAANDNVIFEKCEAIGNGSQGFSVGSSCIFTCCIADKNNSFGFFLNSDARLKNCQANDNSSFGILGFPGSNFDIVNTIANKNADGFILNSNVTLENCHASGNTNFGIECFGTNAFIAHSVASENTEGFNLGSKVLVTKCLAKNNSQFGFNISGNNGTFTCDVAESNGSDGFLVSGSFNTVKDSVSLNNGGAGFDNQGATNIYKRDKARNNAGGNFVTTVVLPPFYIDVKPLKGPFDPKEYIKCCPKCCQKVKEKDECESEQK